MIHKKRESSTDFTSVLRSLFYCTYFLTTQKGNIVRIISGSLPQAEKAERRALCLIGICIRNLPLDSSAL